MHCSPSRPVRPGRSVSSRSEPTPARHGSLALVPLVTYLGVTLLAPALDGAGRNPAFLEHAAITLGVAGLLSWPWLASGWWAARPTQPAPRGPERAGKRGPASSRNERNDSA
jgi:hypothetical protein